MSVKEREREHYLQLSAAANSRATYRMKQHRRQLSMMELVTTEIDTMTHGGIGRGSMKSR